MAEKFPNFSPYAYANDNPIQYSDPTGMQTEDEVHQIATNDGDKLYEGGELDTFTVSAKATKKKGEFWNKLYEHGAKDIPIVGGILNSIESFKEGDTLGGWLGIGEVLIDGALLFSTLGIGNVIKTGTKVGAKVILKSFATET